MSIFDELKEIKPLGKTVGEKNLRKLPDGSYITMYADGRYEVFHRDQDRIKGTGPVNSFSDLFEADFMLTVMNNRPPLSEDHSDVIRLMHALGYFVVPRVV